jgi:hypothetical protein
MIRVLLVIFLCVASVTSAAREIRLSIPTEVKTAFPDVVQVVIEAYQRAGHTVTEIVIPIEREAVMLGAAKVDATVLRIENFRDFVPDAIMVPVPLTQRDVIAIVHESSPIFQVDDLEGLSMANLNGFKTGENLAALFDSPITSVATFESAARMVEYGRVDFFISYEEMVVDVIEEVGHLRVLEAPVTRHTGYTWLSANNADLLPGIIEALESMKNEGRF